MQSATGQYSTHAGEPEQPVQFSLITARMCGFRLRLLVWPLDFGAYLTTSPPTYSSMLGLVYATLCLSPGAVRFYVHFTESSYNGQSQRVSVPRSTGLSRPKRAQFFS